MKTSWQSVIRGVSILNQRLDPIELLLESFIVQLIVEWIEFAQCQCWVAITKRITLCQNDEIPLKVPNAFRSILDHVMNMCEYVFCVLFINYMSQKEMAIIYLTFTFELTLQNISAVSMHNRFMDVGPWMLKWKTAQHLYLV